MRRARKLVGILWAAPCRRGFLRHGVAAALEHEPVLKELCCRTVVDIGANRGQFALATRYYSPETRIISFEPLPAAAARFRQVFADDGRVILHQVAVGPKRGEATLHVSARDDSSSLLPITVLQETLFPGTAEIATETVKVGLLSDFVTPEDIDPPALLKLDVQGFELSVLEGCKDLLDRFAYVYTECSFLELYEGQALADEVIAWVRERGFQLSGVYSMTSDRRGRAVQADFLFHRESGFGVAK